MGFTCHCTALCPGRHTYFRAPPVIFKAEEKRIIPRARLQTHRRAFRPIPSPWTSPIPAGAEQRLGSTSRGRGARRRAWRGLRGGAWAALRHGRRASRPCRRSGPLRPPGSRRTAPHRSAAAAAQRGCPRPPRRSPSRRSWRRGARGPRGGTRGLIISRRRKLMIMIVIVIMIIMIIIIMIMIVT